MHTASSAGAAEACLPDAPEFLPVAIEYRALVAHVCARPPRESDGRNKTHTSYLRAARTNSPGAHRGGTQIARGIAYS